ncbi:hypothetical protein FALBO_4355 [Fusarium albosuccineum]|uniref:Uncharacterized protein n=1 Tax=Fusarium albosuccineum TaxID=1237068 RepID=A0A8H4PDQ8_9HYPO|nr:hypothetical protein FALBO_4355 [Fusarium albosuccineum]
MSYFRIALALAFETVKPGNSWTWFELTICHTLRPLLSLALVLLVLTEWQRDSEMSDLDAGFGTGAAREGWHHCKANPADLVSLDQDNNDFDSIVDDARQFHTDGNLAPEPQDGHGIIEVAHRSAHPLESGHVFTVTMPALDAQRFKDMIQLQWSCILLSAMAGAAGNPELLPHYEDFFGAAAGIQTLDWIAKLQPFPVQGPAMERPDRPEQLPRRDTADHPPLPLRPTTNVPQGGDTSDKMAERSHQSQVIDQTSTQALLTENVRPNKPREQDK